MGINPKTIRLTEREGPSIGVYWAGEFGHLIMNVLPRMNAVRKEFPDHRIIFASYIDDYIYFRDNNKEWTIDEYIGFDWWPVDRGCHMVKGPLTEQAQSAYALLVERSDQFANTTALSLEDFTNEFKKKDRIAYPFKNIIDIEPTDEKYCVVYARAKNYNGLCFRSWEDDKWRSFLDQLLTMLPKDYKVYVCGIGDESVQFKWTDRVIPILDGDDRAEKTLNILSNAKFCISDCSGSGNFAIQCGIPTFVSGPDGYAIGFEKNKNYFGVYVKYQTCDMRSLTPELRIKGFLDFYSGLHYNLEREVYKGVVA